MNQAELDDLQYVKHVVGLKTYEGWAKPGTPLTAKAWRIKLTEFSENPYAYPQPETYEQTIKFPTVGNVLTEKNGLPSVGFKFSWADHEALNYSFLKDVTPPSLTSVTIASDGSVGPSVAVTGDTVTVTVVANEPLSVLAGTIAGRAATVAMGEDAEHWTVSTVMDGSEARSAIAFSLSFRDSSGNAGMVTATSDGSHTTFYATPSATIQYSNDGGLTLHDTVTVTEGQTMRVRATFAESIGNRQVYLSIMDGETEIKAPTLMFATVPGNLAIRGLQFPAPSNVTENATVKLAYVWAGEEGFELVELTSQPFVIEAVPNEAPTITNVVNPRDGGFLDYLEPLSGFSFDVTDEGAVNVTITALGGSSINSVSPIGGGTVSGEGTNVVTITGTSTGTVNFSITAPADDSFGGFGTELIQIDVTDGSLTASDNTIAIMFSGNTWTPTPVYEAHGFAFNNYQSGTDKLGMKVSIDATRTLVSVTKSADTTATRCYFCLPDGTVLASQPFVGDVATFNISGPSGTYLVMVDAEGANYNIGYADAGVSYPHDTGNINWVSGKYITYDNTGAAFAILGITSY